MKNANRHMKRAGAFGIGFLVVFLLLAVFIGLFPPIVASRWYVLMVFLPFIPFWIALWNLAKGIKEPYPTASRLLMIFMVLQMMAAPIVVIGSLVTW